MLGIKISIDIEAALINYYKNKRKIDTKNKRKYCDTVMVIARRVIYASYYREEQIIKKKAKSSTTSWEGRDI